jgi:hypothetical protein
MTPDLIRLVNQRLLLLGKSSFQITPLDGDSLQLETVRTFDSELKDTQPSDLIPAAFSGLEADDLALEPHDYTALDLNSDGKLDLVLLCHDRALFYVRK